MKAVVYDRDGTRAARVYVSGPITKGNRTHNFAQAAEAQRLLMLAGFAVLNPMLSMMHPDSENIDYKLWLASDLPWVQVADYVVRLPGESNGADIETAHARRHGIPVIDYADVECLRSAMYAPIEAAA